MLESIGGRDHARNESGLECRDSLISPAADLHQFDVAGLQADLLKDLQRDIVARAADPVDDDLFPS